jgi:hypothetical protein
MIFVYIWLACSGLSYGFLFAYFRRKYPMPGSYSGDFLFCLGSSLCFGPAALITVFMDGYHKYGFKLI